MAWKFLLVGQLKRRAPQSSCLSSHKAKFIQLDFNESSGELVDLIKKNKIKHIINFAAQGMVAESWITLEDWYQTNVCSFGKLTSDICKSAT